MNNDELLVKTKEFEARNLVGVCIFDLINRGIEVHITNHEHRDNNMVIKLKKNGCTCQYIIFADPSLKYGELDEILLYTLQNMGYELHRRIKKLEEKGWT